MHKIKNYTFSGVFFTVYTPLFAQQVYLFNGKIVTVDSLMYHYETEDAIKQIELLAKQPDKNLSKKEQRQFQLELALLKAKIYDRNFEQGRHYFFYWRFLKNQSPTNSIIFLQQPICCWHR